MTAPTVDRPEPERVVIRTGLDHITCPCGALVFTHLVLCPRCGKSRNEIERINAKEGLDG